MKLLLLSLLVLSIGIPGILDVAAEHECKTYMPAFPPYCLISEPHYIPEMKCITLDGQYKYCAISVKRAPSDCIWIDEYNLICEDPSNDSYLNYKP